MAWTSVPDRGIGYAPVESDWDTSIRDNFNAGAWVALASTKLSTSAASIDFTSINGTFAHLMLMVFHRSDAAGIGNTFLNIRLNNDSGNNYDRQQLSGSGAVGSALEAFATTVYAGLTPAGNATANVFAATRIIIPHYANSTNHKVIVSSSSLKVSASASQLFVTAHALFWRSAAAVTQVNLLPASGNFAAGSSVSLLALP